jgi:Reverse transcriptase (RNA-dependent DNA polymerase)
LDIRWGYNNVRIKDGDEWKVAFKTNHRMFEPLVMFFGLTNSPATFQTMMNDIFRDLINRGHVIIYLDDILIFTETMEEQCQLVKEVLELLWQHKLYLKPEKCDWEKLEVEYLGYIILGSNVKMDPGKIKVISQ